MAKIKSFSRDNTHALSREIEQALESVAAKYGISIKTRGGKYALGQATIKLECVVNTPNGEARDAYEDNFRRFATSFGLRVSDYGKVFTRADRRFTLHGLDPKARKYPVIGKCVSDGKLYKFSFADVMPQLAA